MKNWSGSEVVDPDLVVYLFKDSAFFCFVLFCFVWCLGCG
jgi:hypothetical protein